METPQFAHLHNHTEFSMLDGAAKIPTLFAEAQRLGMPAVAMTNHDDTNRGCTGRRNGMDPTTPLVFTAAYREHHDFIFRYIMGRLHNRDVAEDLTSETFTRAWARIEHYKPHPAGMGPWLTTIARNLILDHLKSSYNQLVTPVYDMWDAEVIEEEPPDDPRLEILPRVMDILTNKQRECVELSKTMTNTQIAEATGNTRRAVTVLKVRAHKQLRKAILQALAAA